MWEVLPAIAPKLLAFWGGGGGYYDRSSSYVADFNTRDKLLTQKLLKQGYRYHKLRNTFSKFYRRMI